MHRRRPLDLDAFLRRLRYLLDVPEPSRDGG